MRDQETDMVVVGYDEVGGAAAHCGAVTDIFRLASRLLAKVNSHVRTSENS